MLKWSDLEPEEQAALQELAAAAGSKVVTSPLVEVNRSTLINELVEYLGEGGEYRVAKPGEEDSGPVKAADLQQSFRAYLAMKGLKAGPTYQKVRELLVSVLQMVDGVSWVASGNYFRGLTWVGGERTGPKG